MSAFQKNQSYLQILLYVYNTPMSLLHHPVLLYSLPRTPTSVFLTHSILETVFLTTARVIPSATMMSSSIRDITSVILSIHISN